MVNGKQVLGKGTSFGFAGQFVDPNGCDEETFKVRAVAPQQDSTKECDSVTVEQVRGISGAPL